MQRRVRGFGKAQGPWRKQRFQVCLDIEIVDVARWLAPLLFYRLTVSDRCYFFRLRVTSDRQWPILYLLITLEYRTGFKQTDTVDFTVQVIANICDQATDQRRAHHAHLAGNRIQQAYGRGIVSKILFPLLFDKTEID